MGIINKDNCTRHWKGVIIYKTGRFYEGDWFNDKRHGLGYEEFANGNRYKGEYRTGKVNG